MPIATRVLVWSLVAAGSAALVTAATRPELVSSAVESGALRIAGLLVAIGVGVGAARLAHRDTFAAAGAWPTVLVGLVGVTTTVLYQYRPTLVSFGLAASLPSVVGAALAFSTARRQRKERGDA